MLIESDSDNASWFVKLSQTKISAKYDPDWSGVHDKAGLNDWLGFNKPVIQPSEIITFSSFFVLFTISIISPIYAIEPLDRTPAASPRLVNAFGNQVIEHLNVNQQVQVTADITNNQEKSQNFVYLVQIKNKADFVVSLGWISGQLTPDQLLSPSLSWTPNKSCEFTAEIFVWGGLINHNAFSNLGSLIVALCSSVNANTGIKLIENISNTPNTTIPLLNTLFWTIFLLIKHFCVDVFHLDSKLFKNFLGFL